MDTDSDQQGRTPMDPSPATASHTGQVAHDASSSVAGPSVPLVDVALADIDCGAARTSLNTLQGLIDHAEDLLELQDRHHQLQRAYQELHHRAEDTDRRLIELAAAASPYVVYCQQRYNAVKESYRQERTRAYDFEIALGERAEDLRVIQQQHDELKKAHAVAVQNAHNVQVEVTDLKAAKREAESKRDSLREQLDDSDRVHSAEVSELQKELSSRQIQLDRCLEARDDLEQRLYISETRWGDTASQLEETKTKQLRSSAALAEALDQVDIARATISRLEQQVANSAALPDRQQQEILVLKSKLEAARSTLATTIHDRDNLAGELRDTKAKNEELQQGADRVAFLLRPLSGQATSISSITANPSPPVCSLPPSASIATDEQASLSTPAIDGADSSTSSNSRGTLNLGRGVPSYAVISSASTSTESGQVEAKSPSKSTTGRPSLKKRSLGSHRTADLCRQKLSARVNRRRDNRLNDRNNSHQSTPSSQPLPVAAASSTSGTTDRSASGLNGENEITLGARTASRGTYRSAPQAAIVTESGDRQSDQSGTSERPIELDDTDELDGYPTSQPPVEGSTGINESTNSQKPDNHTAIGDQVLEGNDLEFDDQELNDDAGQSGSENEEYSKDDSKFNDLLTAEELASLPATTVGRSKWLPGYADRGDFDASDIEPWGLPDILQTSVLEMTLDTLYHQFSKPTEWLFPQDPQTPGKGQWNPALVSAANVQALLNAEPWNGLESSITPLSFAPVGWFVTLVKVYREFEAKHRQAFWEATHRIVFRGKDHTSNDFIKAYLLERRRRRSRAGDRWKRSVLVVVLQGMISGVCDLDILLDPFFLHLPTCKDRKNWYPCVDASRTDRPSSKKAKQKPSLIDALVQCDRKEPWRNQFRPQSKDHPARKIERLKNKFVAITGPSADTE